MRQIFTSLPYVLPADPPEIAALYRARGSERVVKKGETLKRGGEDAKLFFITEGLAAYFIAEELTGRPKVLGLLPPERAAGDLTAAIENRCNVHTKMITDGKVLVLPASILTEAMRSEGGFAEVLVRSVIAKEECHIEGMVANFTLPPEQRLKVFLQSALTHENGCVEGGGMVADPLSALRGARGRDREPQPRERRKNIERVVPRRSRQARGNGPFRAPRPL